MGKVLETVEELRKYVKSNEPYWAEAVRYLETGDRAILTRIGQSTHLRRIWLSPIWGAMGPADAMGEEDRRSLHMLAASREDQAIGEWLSRSLVRERPDGDVHGLVATELRAANMSEPTILALTAGCVAALSHDGWPTSAGRFVLSRSVDELKRALGEDVLTKDLRDGAPLAAFLRDFARDRLPELFEYLAMPGRFTPEVAQVLLDANDPECHEVVLTAFRAMPRNLFKLEVARKLLERDRNRHGAEALAFARDLAIDPQFLQGTVVIQMVEIFGDEVLEDVKAYVGSSTESAWYKTRAMTAAVKAFGERAIPSILAALKGGDPETRNAALGHLIALDGGTHAGAVRSGFELCLGSTEANDLVVALRLTAAGGDLVPYERVWPLLEHKSKPVREAAARTLGRLGDEAAPRAEGLLADRKATTRAAAVTLLSAAGTPLALAALEARLDLEGDEDIRDAMLTALDAARRTGGREVTREEVEVRVDRVAAKIQSLAVDWLDEPTLPPLRDRDERPLRAEAVRYLLYRQSRVKEMRPDVEARPLYALVDRATSGDFALQVLKRFAGSKAAAEDRWALAVAGLLGDDRAVSLLSGLINQWADSGRGKMAEYAVQALALLGTDAALTTLDAMAIRYRVKLKNIGQAAVDAFEAAAERMGVTPDELGDRVVPRLGFSPDGPRLIDCGGRAVEASIGLDFKLRFRDVEKNKPIASLPKSAPKAIQDEFKGLSATLREVIKSQLLRLENLMVRQHRWPVGRWSELFLAHPVLRPFAARLVWGVYSPEGTLLTTFRSLEDRTLTDATDGAIELPADNSVGMVHPLDLDDATRLAWATHLADYEVAPPFPQLERPVVRVDDDRRAVTMGHDLEGTTVAALTFKGRAGKLGWARGSVTDGGAIDSYRKTFPASGLEAFLGLEDFYMGAGIGDELKLESYCFVKSGSVQVGSYVYDNPSSEDDPRLIPFGDVPPVVFSEVMGDLRAIAGRGREDQEKD